MRSPTEHNTLNSKSRLLAVRETIPVVLCKGRPHLENPQNLGIQRMTTWKILVSPDGDHTLSVKQKLINCSSFVRSLANCNWLIYLLNNMQLTNNIHYYYIKNFPIYESRLYFDLLITNFNKNLSLLDWKLTTLIIYM